MTPLELRKRLLIAESEINRAQLRQEWEKLAAGLGGLADRAKTIGTYASVAAALVAGLATVRRSQAAPVEAKRSWMRTVVKGLRIAASIWLALRPRRHGDDSPSFQGPGRESPP